MRGDQEIHQSLVQWGQDGLQDNSWEDSFQFFKLFSEFNLEDKVVLDGESNDTSIVVTNQETSNHATLGDTIVTNFGQVSADPQFEGLRRSKKERTNSNRLEGLRH
ncbi:hypothetical protein PIB30_031283 [Stylosanthes scabra]|uniref:Uncharacterized protein n=1 Tax=Stylosanthes scabra TaxID=79078 RepID=A0ABU6YAJ3_9FABA|nr:hypothetical protein [Stylosanthes scabra]